MTDNNEEQYEQLHFAGFEQLAPSDIKEESSEQNVEVVPVEETKNQIIVTSTQDLVPSSILTAAQSSMNLRNILNKLADTVTNDDYLSLIASTAPQSIPDLVNSVTNGIATSDNLMIRMAQVSEKSAAMQRVFDYMTKKQEKAEEKAKNVEKDKFYDSSVEKIKKAIYERLDTERNSQPTHNAELYKNPSDDDVIDAEYTIPEEGIDGELKED